jgi:hypothetical protein
VIEALADHWEAGERWDRAAACLLRAAHKAKARHGLDQARQLSARALAAAERASAAIAAGVDALVLLGDLAGLKGDPEEANTHYANALGAETDPARRQAIANRRHEPRHLIRAGGQIAWYEHGAGTCTLVFVHPFLYGLAVFQPLVEVLCQEFRIITIDPRGTGGSSPITPDYGMHDHMEDVRAVIETAVPEGKVIAIGLSRGALILIRLAPMYPALLDRMILVGGFTRQTVGLGAPHLGDANGVVRQMTTAMRPVICGAPPNFSHRQSIPNRAPKNFGRCSSTNVHPCRLKR